MTIPVYSVRPDDPDFFNNPYPHYQRMRALGPAFVWKEYGRTCFAGHDTVNAVLRDRRFGREITHLMSREAAGLEPIPKRLKPFYDFESHSMLEREPPAHTRLRGLVNRAFVSRHIERLRGSIERLAHSLIDNFEHAGTIDLLPAYAEKIPVTVICELLGVPVSMSDQLLDWSHNMVAMYQFNRTEQTGDRAVTALQAFSNFIIEYIDKRRKSPGDDLISLLIAAEEKGDRLTKEELVTTCILLLNAGHEATVHGIGNALKALIENKVDVKRVFATPESANAASDELLRFDPPLHLFSRYVLEDLEFAGLKLTKGQSVSLLLGSANHDPGKFRAAERLDFIRGAAGHLAFGAGIHFCVGAPLARLEMAAAIPILFNRLPQIRIAETPSYGDRYHFHGLEHLHADW